MLLGYIWLLGTFVNSSCDIKINVNIVQNCCRNLAVRGLSCWYDTWTQPNTLKLHSNVKLTTRFLSCTLPSDFLTNSNSFHIKKSYKFMKAKKSLATTHHSVAYEHFHHLANFVTMATYPRTYVLKIKK